MSIVQLLVDIALVSVLVGLAVGALLASNLTRSVVLFMTFGLVMAFTWARLSAPDIALVELAIGSGLTGTLLLSTVRVLQNHASEDSEGRDK